MGSRASSLQAWVRIIVGRAHTCTARGHAVALIADHGHASEEEVIAHVERVVAMLLRVAARNTSLVSLDGRRRLPKRGRPKQQVRVEAQANLRSEI